MSQNRGPQSEFFFVSVPAVKRRKAIVFLRNFYFTSFTYIAGVDGGGGVQLDTLEPERNGVQAP